MMPQSQPIVQLSIPCHENKRTRKAAIRENIERLCTLFSNRPGFQNEVHQQLLDEAKIQSLPEDRCFAAFINDEMKIKEGLVYNMHSGELNGFTHLGDINNEFMKLE